MPALPEGGGDVYREGLKMAEQKAVDRVVPLLDVCGVYFGLGAEVAKRRALEGTLPVPAFRLDGRKSPWLVRSDDLSAFVEERYAAARENWRLVQGVTG